MHAPLIERRRVTRSATYAPVAVLGLLVACLAVGYGISHDERAALAVVGVALIVAVAFLAGVERLTLLALIVLPWLVLFIDVTPTLTLTFASAAAALLLLISTPLLSDIRLLPWLAVWLFVSMVLGQVAANPHGSQLIEASKYSLFPAMALVASSQTARSRLVPMRRWLLISGVGAMGVDGLAILLHLGSVGDYYGVGERLGLTAQSPHEIALIGVMVAVACLLTVSDIRLRLAGATIAALPAVATGVRSPLVALAVTLVVLAVRARFRPSIIVAIAVMSGAIIFSGVGSIIVARYQRSQATGEFTSFSTLGSDRGAVWTTALHSWSSGSPLKVIFGSGLRSIEAIEQQQLGEEVTAQSDAVATLVELGIVGFVAWILIWLALIRSGINWLILLPLASYAITNGALEYVGAVVFGIALATACSRARGPSTVVESRDTSSSRELAHADRVPSPA